MNDLDEKKKSKENNNICTPTVSWSSIVQDFTQKYRDLCEHKKAHFDSMGVFSETKVITIDGATIKWCEPMLLDAVIYRFFNGGMTISKKTHRKFDQHLELQKSILKITKELKGSDFILTDIQDPWTSFECFQSYILGIKHTKYETQQKAEILCAATCQNHSCSDLTSVLRTVILSARRHLLPKYGTSKEVPSMSPVHNIDEGRPSSKRLATTTRLTVPQHSNSKVSRANDLYDSESGSMASDDDGEGALTSEDTAGSEADRSHRRGGFHCKRSSSSEIDSIAKKVAQPSVSFEEMLENLQYVQHLELVLLKHTTALLGHSRRESTNIHGRKKSKIRF